MHGSTALTTGKTCANAWCRQSFDVTDGDLEFYDKVSPVFGDKKYKIPPPTSCPDCRAQRRLAFRDERKLYKRTCDATGEEMITPYAPNNGYKVYNQKTWWSDAWSAIDFGREFDFSRNFFQQWEALLADVPKLQQSAYNNENCPFINRCSNSRNCHMCFNLDRGEDAYYCEVGYKLTTCVDCGFSKEMELCSDCMESFNCYRCTNLQLCSDLSESRYCFDCHGGSNLVLCWNLRNKEYHIGNVPYSKEEYRRKLAELALHLHTNAQTHRQQLMQNVQQHAVHKYANFLHCEHCTGDHIFQSKNCEACYDVLRGEDLKYVVSVDNDAKDSMDCASIWDGAELNFESMSTSRFRVLFSYNIWESSDVLYSELCKGCSNIFGCSGLHKEQYCILNKQYAKEEYEELVPKIIAHMQSTGEWGEFFPIHISPFAYNETVAQEYFPMTKEEVKEKGWKWRDQQDELPKVDKIIPASKLPPSIDDIPDDILNWAIECETTKRPFRIIRQELDFYRKMRLPIPHFHPDERHKRRMALRNPRKLWDRQCAKCAKPIQTTYAPERPEQVFCEECYLKEVY